MLDRLPCDITTLILKQAVGVQAQSTKSWSQTIPLSFISRKLRALAKPWIHYWAFIECYDAPEEELSDADEYTDEPVWMTNVDFHALCGYTSKVRKLELYLDAPVHLLTFFGESMKILDAVHTKWEYMRSLNLNLYSVLDEVDDLDLSEHEQNGRMSQIATILSQSLANLTKLQLRTHLSHHTNTVTTSFANKLVDLYSLKLQVLFNQVPIDPSAICFSDKLKRIGLFVNAPSLSDSFKIDSSSLTDIMLVRMPLSFSWSALECQQDAEVYDFPDLQNLEVFFDSPRTIPGFFPDPQPNELDLVSGGRGSTKVVRVNMPKLKLLRLEFASPECPVFYSQTHFHHLKEIMISGSFTLIRQLTRLKLQDVSIMVIYIDSLFASDEESFYKVTNHIFGEIVIRKNATLSMRCTLPFTIDPDKISWTHLKTMDLGIKIEFTILMDMLHHTPSLHTLIFGNVSFERFLNDVGHIDSPRWTELIESPINSNVKKLHVEGQFANYSTHFMSNIIYFLIQRLPSLQKANIDAPMFKDQVNMLLKQSEKPHPNVRHITVVELE